MTRLPFPLEDRTRTDAVRRSSCRELLTTIALRSTRLHPNAGASRASPSPRAVGTPARARLGSALLAREAVAPRAARRPPTRAFRRRSRSRDGSFRGDARHRTARRLVGALDAALLTRGRAHLAKSTVVAAPSPSPPSRRLVALGGPASPRARRRTAPRRPPTRPSRRCWFPTRPRRRADGRRRTGRITGPVLHRPRGRERGQGEHGLPLPGCGARRWGCYSSRGRPRRFARAAARRRKAHDSLTVPSASVSGTKAGNESGESVDGLTRDDRYSSRAIRWTGCTAGTGQIAARDSTRRRSASAALSQILAERLLEPKRDEKRGGEAATPSAEERGSRRKSGRWTSGVSCRTRTCARSRRTCWSRCSGGAAVDDASRWTAHWRG